MAKVGPLSIIKSALAALFGVQSKANRERDFQSGQFWHFFIAGALVTLLFLGGVYLLARLIMSGVL